MRLAKLSLAAIVALGVSAFADVQNVKFGGDAKLFYGTNDADYMQVGLRNPSGDLFSKDNSYGQAALDLWATADVGDGAKAKLEVTMLNTLGLEKNLVSNVWSGGVGNQWWVSEAWLAKTFGNTTIKVGRQELDTPLAFTEKWNIAENTFDAAVVLNNDLPKTTLVAAWVGRGNGAPGFVVRDASGGQDPFHTYGSAIATSYFGVPGIDAREGILDQINGGAYALAAVTKLIPMTTAQVWYYDVNDIATAWWLQADVDLKELLPGLTFGAQYTNLDPADTIDAAVSTFLGQPVNLDNSQAWAVKLGYAMDNLKLAAAYSKADKDGAITIANTATGTTQGSQSKFYTEAWWNYGYVGAPNAKSWMLSAEYNMEGIADFYAQYTSVNDAITNVPSIIQSRGAVDPKKADMKEFTLTASKSFGNLDATLAYIYTDADDQNINPRTNKADSYNTVQVYLTYNF